MFTLEGPHIVMSRTDAQNGLDFHFNFFNFLNFLFFKFLNFLKFLISKCDLHTWLHNFFMYIINKYGFSSNLKKNTLVSFSNTSNCTHPSDEFSSFLKTHSCMFFSKLHSKNFETVTRKHKHVLFYFLTNSKSRFLRFTTSHNIICCLLLKTYFNMLCKLGRKQNKSCRWFSYYA
jgi:hypothetical protein